MKVFLHLKNCTPVYAASKVATIFVLLDPPPDIPDVTCLASPPTLLPKHQNQYFGEEAVVQEGNQKV